MAIAEEPGPFRPWFMQPLPEVHGTWRKLLHPRMLASYALYAAILRLFMWWFDPITPFWIYTALFLGVASLPWGFWGWFRQVVDETVDEVEQTEEDIAEAEEHHIRTSEPHGVPDDLSELDKESDKSSKTGDGLEDLTDLEDFDVQPEEPDPQDDDD